MLAIIKIDESFAVVDLDEDTELFESLDEAEDMMLEYMSAAKVHRYRQKAKFHADQGEEHAKQGKMTSYSELKRDAHKAASRKHFDKSYHMDKRLNQRWRAKNKLKSVDMLKSKPG
jgi:hypothetical protein